MESISHATVYFLRDKVFDVVRVSDIFGWNEDLFNKVMRNERKVEVTASYDLVEEKAILVQVALVF